MEKVVVKLFNVPFSMISDEQVSAGPLINQAVKMASSITATRPICAVYNEIDNTFEVVKGIAKVRALEHMCARGTYKKTTVPLVVFTYEAILPIIELAIAAELL